MENILNTNQAIDVHNHWLPKEYIDLVKMGEVKPLAEYSESDSESVFIFPGPQPGKKIKIPVHREFYDWQLRDRDMKNMELTKTVISPLPFSFHYAGEATIVADIHKLINDKTAQVVAQDHKHFRGLANVPLQSVNLAIDELQRSMTKLGLSGVHIASNVQGKYLGEPEFHPFFEACEQLGAFILIHPVDVAAYDRLNSFYFRNLIGNPLDTTICAGSLIFNEVLKKYPKLKICLCHAGGYLPIVFGRWNHGHKVRTECKHLDRSPSEYLRSFYYDIITHSKEALSYLIKLNGADRVVIGTDYPLDMGLNTPVAALRETDIEESQFNTICFENAQDIFKF